MVSMQRVSTFSYLASITALSQINRTTVVNKNAMQRLQVLRILRKKNLDTKLLLIVDSIESLLANQPLEGASKQKKTRLNTIFLNGLLCYSFYIMYVFI